MVFVDVYVLDHDGNLIDAAAMAALGALVKREDARLQSQGRRSGVQG